MTYSITCLLLIADAKAQHLVGEREALTHIFASQSYSSQMSVIINTSLMLILVGES